MAAQQEGYVDDTLSKCWTQLSYLDDNTEDDKPEDKEEVKDKLEVL